MNSESQPSAIAKPSPTLDEAAEKRFWASVYAESGEGCWAWIRSLTRGYGIFFIGGRSYSAHRIAYELCIGPIPWWAQLDHLCRNRRCVNPMHLEPVDNSTNTIRALASRENLIWRDDHVCGFYSRFICDLCIEKQRQYWLEQRRAAARARYARRKQQVCHG